MFTHSQRKLRRQIYMTSLIHTAKILQSKYKHIVHHSKGFLMEITNLIKTLPRFVHLEKLLAYISIKNMEKLSIVDDFSKAGYSIDKV